MSDTPASTEQEYTTTSAAANPPSGIQLTKPLDEMSSASVAVVADAAGIIARQKLEAAVKAAAAAKAALERVAALKAGTAPIAATPMPEPVLKLEPVAAPAILVVQETPEPVVDVPPEAPVVMVVAEPNPDAEIARMAGNLRATLAAQTPKRKKPTGKRSLDPIAGSAGLYSGPKKRRKIMTPGLAFLLIFMAFYALYASGNLPEFDRWSDSMANSAHAHNDQIVARIFHLWRILLGVGAALVAVAVGARLWHSVRHR